MGNTWGSSGSIPISGVLEGSHSAERPWCRITQFAMHCCQHCRKFMHKNARSSSSTVCACLWGLTVISLSHRVARLFCLVTWNTSARTVCHWSWTAQNAAASMISAGDVRKTARWLNLHEWQQQKTHWTHCFTSALNCFSGGDLHKYPALISCAKPAGL